MRSTASRSRLAALISSPPTTIAVRDATVGPESGTTAVSGAASSTASIGTSSASATSCGKIVLVPWPISVEAVRIRISPSAVSSSEATEASFTSPEPVKPAPCQASARPTPLATRSRPVRSGEPGHGPGSRAPITGRIVACPQTLELGGLGRPLQDLLAGHALAEDLAGRRRVAEPVDVAPPDLERAEAERLGDPVELGLGGELHLGRPESAEGAVGRRVGAGRPRPNPDVRAAIGAARVDRAARQDDRRERAVRPAVHHHLDLLGDQPAVVGHAGSVADDRRVALGRRREVLVAVVDHPDRSPGLAGQERGMERDQRGVLLLATEPAAGLGLDHASAAVVEAQPSLERGMDVVRALERAGHRHAAVVTGDGDHRVVLDVELLLVADAVLALEDQVGGGEGSVRVAGRELVGGEDVVGGERVEDRRERLGPDAHGKAGGAQGRPVRGPRAGPAARRGAGSRRRPGRGSAGPP